MDEVKKKYGESYKHKGYDNRLCINCNTKRFITQKDKAADMYIVQHMNAKRGPIINWARAVEIDMSLPVSLDCPTFLFFAKQPIRVRTFKIHDNNPTPMFISRIAGGKHPKDFQYHPSQLAHNPGDGSIGLLLLGDNDFAMVDTSYISNEAIYELSAQETGSILDMDAGSRWGVAGGRFQVSDNKDHDVQSLSPATKHDRVFIAKESSSSTLLDVLYINYDRERGKPTVELFGSLYNEVLMKRKNKREKRNDTLKCKYLREKYLSEMKSRLRCFCVMDKYGLRNTNHDHWQSFKAAVSRTTNGVVQEWRMADHKLTLFDCVLLEWCCSTGEMRNHQALSVHKDGNKSHSVESMQAFGRIDPLMSHLGETIQVQYFRDAILCALWQMVALRVRCGRDIWHLSWGNTFHLADRSRDRYNVTWVHGP
jgi:hypothetical protein